MGDLVAVALGLAWSLLRPRRQRQPRAIVSAPPDPLTINDVHAPPAPTWGAQRGAC